MQTRKVFISYSWTTPEHENWVVNLSNRLVLDGVNVVLDKWDLKEGHDKYHFMETMVTSEEVNKVLLILDKKYSLRADDREGGVGTETMIISPQMYENTSQEKFIPIVTEVDENGIAFRPTYLKARIYIDLSNEDVFETGYEQLLRSIYNRPSISKPKLGSAPSYLFEDSPVQYRTATIVRSLNSTIEKYPNRVNGLIRDLLDEYLANLKDFVVEYTENTYEAVGEAVFNKLNQYQLLKKDFVDFFDRLFKSESPFDIDIILNFLEKLPDFINPETKNSGCHYEHFKLIINELFLYTVGLALKNGNYNVLLNVFHTKYILQVNYFMPKDTNDYTVFRYHYNTMDKYYNKLKNSNFYSVHADYMITHMPIGYDKDLLIEADLLSYYVAELNNMSWFPTTYIYKNSQRRGLNVLSRLISKKHFNKIKNVLGFDTIEELKIKIKEFELNPDNRRRGYSSGFSDPIPNFSTFIDIESIGSSL